ncbi:MAG: pyridoxine 5'-phosphate synthase [Gemmatimonadota bacterium]|nr:pyridoxine 5'-phosphate synthase [Gemmatimonadota bacterium]MDP6529737.1 pyridoxine 5'-phosphate synthase [Gemmatimonadota bacterium]MDP6803641.1 pyridoxine 5'-phosphate synthase [Gemmatimonadota bacterium]MDP7030919.1 pyridoxine 5'-phosphate synthase [Gemmatimonadota bacterium]
MRLGVNVDHVATLREARKGRQPDPVTAALLCEEAGADQITIHLREDRRHIQDRDVRLLREVVQTRLNLEMAATDEMVAIALAVRPETATLVPERRQELTTEGGLDVVSSTKAIAGVVAELAAGGIRTSLFVDPDLEQVKAALRTGAAAVELHTGTYADATDEETRAQERMRVADAAVYARRVGLEPLAGHGLDYRNTQDIARIPELTELNIGHSIVSRAVLVGLHTAVAEMVALIRANRPAPAIA